MRGHAADDRVWNLLIPATTFITLRLTSTDPGLRKTAVLALALPAAPLQITLAVQHATGEKENASYLLFSTLLSIPTLAGFIWLLG